MMQMTEYHSDMKNKTFRCMEETADERRLKLYRAKLKKNSNMNAKEEQHGDLRRM